MEIKPRETMVLKSEDYNKDIIFSIKSIPHVRNGNTYYSALNKGGKKIEYKDDRVENGLKIFDIKQLPKENLTISIVYSVEKHNVITSYYRYSPGGFVKNHNNEKMNSKEPTTLTGFTYETVTVDAPKKITDSVNGNDEVFNLVYAYIDDEPMSLPFDPDVDIGRVDKNVELVYQRDEFDLTYNNNGGSGCSNTRIKFNKEYGELCKPIRTGYNFKGWSLTDGGQVIKSTDINKNYQDLTLHAVWEAKVYTITYHMGNASATAGSHVIKTKTCTFDKTCTLDTFASLGVVFPYSIEYEKLDEENNASYGWSFAGWTNYEKTMEIKYSDGYSFIYDKDYDLDLYAMGKRNLHINGGINPTKTLYNLPQTWNPYSTSTEYLTEVTLPAGKEISGWTFIGYKPGNSQAVGTVKFDNDDIGKPFKAEYNVWPFIRSAYQRNVTLDYNANGGTGTTESQTKVQYYNSGFASENSNREANVSKPVFNLATNKFNNSGYSFRIWAEGSGSGTEYAAGSSYTFAPEVTQSNKKVFYAKWNILDYTITYNLNGGTNPSGIKNSYKVTDETYTLPTPTRTGYTFAGWYTESSFTNKVTSIPKGSTENKTFYAKWNENYLLVYYEPKDATVIKYENVNKNATDFKNESYSKYYYSVTTDTGLANVQNTEYIYLERTGYKPTGYWYNGSIKFAEDISVSGKTLSEHFGLDISSSSKSLTIYPEWEIINYTITYNLNGGTNPSGVKSSYKVTDETYTLPTPTRTGYTFAGWYTESSFTNKVNSIAKGSTGNKNLYAKWNENYVTVTYVPKDATTIQFKGVTKTAEQFQSETKSVHYYDTVNDSGLANPDNPDWINIARTGYVSTGYWYNGSTRIDYNIALNGKELASHFGLNISSGNATLNLYPEWKAQNYSITYNLNGGSNPSSAKLTYTINDAYTLPIPTKSGQVFDGWYTTSTFTGSKVTSIAKGSTGNKTFYAKWKSNRLYLVKSGQDQTSVTGGWNTYDHYLAGGYGRDPDVSFDSTRMKVWEDNYTNCSGTVYTRNKINFAGFTKLVFDGTVVEGMDLGASLKIKTQAGSEWSDYKVYTHNWDIYDSDTKTEQFNGDVTIDISGYNGSYVVGFGIFGNNHKSPSAVRVYNLWLE